MVMLDGGVGIVIGCRWGRVGNGMGWDRIGWDRIGWAGVGKVGWGGMGWDGTGWDADPVVCSVVRGDACGYLPLCTYILCLQGEVPSSIDTCHYL